MTHNDEFLIHVLAIATGIRTLTILGTPKIEVFVFLIANRPIIIMMSGNKKQIDLKALEKYGEVKELKYKDIFR